MRSEIFLAMKYDISMASGLVSNFTGCMAAGKTDQ